MKLKMTNDQIGYCLAMVKAVIQRTSAALYQDAIYLCVLRETETVLTKALDTSKTMITYKLTDAQLTSILYVMNTIYNDYSFVISKLIEDALKQKHRLK